MAIVPANYRILQTMNWTTWTPSNLTDSINLAKATGINVIALFMRKAWVTTYRNAATDPLKDAMAYAASKGIRFMMLLDHDEYGSREQCIQTLQRKPLFSLIWPG